MADAKPSSSDIADNADAAITEIRRQIDEPLRTAASIDTRALTLLSALGVGAGLLAPRVHVDGQIELVLAGAAFFLTVASAVLALAVIRVRSVFSFGVDARPLVDELEKRDKAGLRLMMADSLADARDINDGAIDEKDRWFKWQIATFTLALALVPLMLVGGVFVE